MDMMPLKLHVMTACIIVAVLMIIIFFTNNPIILFSVFIYCSIVFMYTRNKSKLVNGFIYFIPFLFVSVIINFLFITEGKIILFEISNKVFTLESLVYAFIFSFKLLLIIYIFMILNILVDSDNAISFFSSKIPKTTLLVMIGIKFFPIMKNRINSLKSIYTIRGVEFNGKSLKEKILAYVPIFSILLENSLEGAFDIGEAAYVRGFLSSTRTIYDKQKFQCKDYILYAECATTLIFGIIFKIYSFLEFDIYGGININKSINIGVISIFISILVIGFTSFFKVDRME